MRRTTNMGTLPGLEQYAIGAEFPLPYVPNFETAAEADEFYEFFSKWDYCQAKNAYGLTLRRKGAAFVPAEYLQHSQVISAVSPTGKAILPDSSTVEEDDHCHGPVLPSSEAPDCLRRLNTDWKKSLFAGRLRFISKQYLCYGGVVGRSPSREENDFA